MRLTPPAILLTLSAGIAQAAPPEVITDIPPVHSLVAQVMEGVGTPQLLLPPGGSPHGHQMRPSEAQALQAAGILFWIGPAQSPWLAEASNQLGHDLRSVALMEIDGTVLRMGGHDHSDHAAEHDDHADHDHGHDDHGHDDHEKEHGSEAHEEHEDHDAHEDAHHAGDGHDHTGLDPHVWLDPANALIWLPEIAHHLSDADPENAATYRANAEAAMAGISGLKADIDARLKGLDGGYVVYHDAYGYFTDRFNLPPAGMITDGDATPPGARRLADLQAEAAGIKCLFTEPQFDSRAAQRLAETLDAQVGVLDPVGSTLEPGPQLYTQLLDGLATALSDCLGG
ncbi:zinc ABC transporter substrate-binding protein [Pseudooceanicola onchidii]|uniref:zinc ABC transporter substrate-binding protein n=1 Tax=Pseudooceanicola onchidii TaxID=2562279 RepID=UPI0010AA83A0|nr:zinc ABC transporter substrate-binding protein [Pseudooceanicola onchidii]